MDTKIDYKVFGSQESWVSPYWSCLVNPDSNLKKYYKAVLNTPFNKKRFRRAGVFRNIGKINSRFDNLSIRCLDLPIKMAGSKEYRIPTEFNQFLEVISNAISFEVAHNEDLVNFYAYLTIDQSQTKIGDTHRNAGLHVDGFQGARINPKVWCDRSYIICDCDTPSFYNQSFETVENMDDNTQNVFHEFDKTAHYSSEIRCIPYCIYMMDCYAVHGANKSISSNRTFVRLTFSVREFDRLGNSHNNCFNYNWKMIERNISQILK